MADFNKNKIEPKILNASTERTFFLSILILIACYFILLPLQTQDGPNHKQVAKILERLEHSPIEQQVYEKNISILGTNLAYPVLFGKFAKILSPDHFEKIFFLFCIVSILLGYRYLLKFWDPRQMQWNFWALPLCFHVLFLSGMYNFMLSVPLSLFALGLLSKNTHITRAMFYISSYFAYWAHPFSIIVIILIGSIYFLQNKKKINQYLIFLPLLLLFLLSFLLPHFQSPHLKPNEATLLFKSPLELFAGLSYYQFPIFDSIDLFYLAPFLTLIFYLFFKNKRSLIPWLCIICYFVFPSESKGGAHINERFLIYFYLFIPIFLKQYHRNLFKISMSIILLVTSCLALRTFQTMSKIDHHAKQIEVLLKDLPEQSTFFPIQFRPKTFTLSYSALLHSWANYPEDKIIFSPYLFAYLPTYPLRLIEKRSQTYFPNTEVDFAEQSLNSPNQEENFVTLIEKSRHYDYTLISFAPENFIAQIKSIQSFEMIHEDSQLILVRNTNATPFTPSLFSH